MVQCRGSSGHGLRLSVVGLLLGGAASDVMLDESMAGSFAYVSEIEPPRLPARARASFT